jgi:hypothetical protein
MRSHAGRVATCGPGHGVARRCAAAVIAANTLVAAPSAALHTGKFEEPAGYALWECTGTDSKPQSKLWYHDGSFWCVVDGPGGNGISRLVGTQWIPQVTALPALETHTGRADVLCADEQLYMLLFDAHPALFEFTYDATRRQYEPVRGTPVSLAVPAGSETMVLDRDSTGRLWATYTTGGNVYVTHSGRDARHWDLPGMVLQDSVSSDDVSTLVAFGDAAIGVFWSDQTRDAFGFRVHADDDPPSNWSVLEVVDPGPGHADDHVHLTADGSGQVYAITKDDLHHLSAHVRSRTGAWTDIHDVLGGKVGTRPILMCAEADSTLYLLYTRWREGINTIDCRTSPLGHVQFGPPAHFIVVPDLDLNDVSGMKQTLPAGCLVAMCSGGGMAWWNGWGEPPRPPGGEDTAPPVAWPWNVAVHPVPVCTDAVLALAFDEGAGDVSDDASAQDAVAQLGGPWAGDLAEPAWIPGVAGTALRFDGERDFVEVAALPQLDLQQGMTVEAWVRRTRDHWKETICSKGTPGNRNYQVRFLPDDRLEFLWETEEGANHGLEGQRAVADTLWHHVACVYDPTAGESRIFVDGVLDRAAPDSGVPAVNDTPLYIGLRLGDKGPKDWFRGDIDQLRITPSCRYAASFTPSAGFGTSSPSVAFLDWPLRQGPGLDALDFDILRRSEDGQVTQLNPSPVHGCHYCDRSPPAGHLRYEVHCRGRHGDPQPASVDWPPPRVVQR